jgi:hypothetical protein
MLTGSERSVLSVCLDLAGNGHGFILDADIAERSGMGLTLIRECLRGLDREGYVDLVPLESGEDKHGVCLAVVPGNCELDLKSLARATGNKKIDTVPLKKVEPLTGYIRGGMTMDF